MTASLPDNEKFACAPNPMKEENEKRKDKKKHRIKNTETYVHANMNEPKRTIEKMINFRVGKKKRRKPTEII